MKSFKQFLEEGLIKINDDMVRKISDIVFEYTIRYIIYYYRNKNHHELMNIIKKIKENISHHNLPEISLSRLYRKSDNLFDLYRYDRKMLKFTFEDNYRDITLYLNFGGAAQLAFFNQSPEYIQFNIKYMLQDIIEHLYKTLDKYLANNYLTIIYSSIVGTIKHELTHRNQLLHKYHEKQTELYDTKRKDSEEAYYMSQVEFDPMIKSSIENIKTLKKLYPDDMNVINYYIGVTNTKPKNYNFDRSSFLSILKKRAPIRYKKALKYIFRNI